MFLSASLMHFLCSDVFPLNLLVVEDCTIQYILPPDSVRIQLQYQIEWIRFILSGFGMTSINLGLKWSWSPVFYLIFHYVVIKHHYLHRSKVGREEVQKESKVIKYHQWWKLWWFNIIFPLWSNDHINPSKVVIILICNQEPSSSIDMVKLFC